MNTTDTHHTAWITTDHTCLEGDFADVVVLEDQVSGYRETGDGDEIGEWTSTSNEKFAAVTGLRHDGDHDQIIAEAVKLLSDAGWDLAGDTEWEAVTTGYIAVVEYTS